MLSLAPRSYFNLRARSQTTRNFSKIIPGPVAIVTGASRGIGKAVAVRLAQDGYDLALNDVPGALEQLRGVEDSIGEYGRQAIVCPGDVSSEKDIQALVKSAADALGGLDVMVANAGICITKPFIETTSEDWDKIQSINTRGTFLCYRYAALKMIEQGRGGRIVGVSSVPGEQAWANVSAYSSSKFGIRGLTQAAAAELGKYKINVNAYAPGPVNTDMLVDIGHKLGNKSTFYEESQADTVLGRYPNPEDIAALVSFLVSPDSKMLTGQTIVIDSGRLFD
ncbi:hypothetical protein D9611_006714 [Ephemerocybe angulata]|uniref:Uncharacterized protein n=1 Tax=Ephemerocybe angulata TaxID=980116 RepID=A0A8H5FGY0_9AGAR|nr:hypothetical protein D9611_006714 [Tulosesus angulatus]